MKTAAREVTPCTAASITRNDVSENKIGLHSVPRNLALGVRSTQAA